MLCSAVFTATPVPGHLAHLPASSHPASCRARVPCVLTTAHTLQLLRPCCRGDNIVAIDLITEHIRMKLQQHDLRRIYPNLEVRCTLARGEGSATLVSAGGSVEAGGRRRLGTGRAAAFPPIPARMARLPQVIPTKLFAAGAMLCRPTTSLPARTPRASRSALPAGRRRPPWRPSFLTAGAAIPSLLSLPACRSSPRISRSAACTPSFATTPRTRPISCSTRTACCVW